MNQVTKNIIRVEKNEPGKIFKFKSKLDSYFDCRGEINSSFNEKYAKIKQ